MKKWKIVLAVLLAVALLIPMHTEVDDGGTEHFTAALWQATKKHSLAEQDGTQGYMTGMIVKILFIEIYNDVHFSPE